MRSFPESASQFLTEKHCEFEDKIMRISSIDVIEGSHVLYGGEDTKVHELSGSRERIGNSGREH